MRILSLLAAVACGLSSPVLAASSNVNGLNASGAIVGSQLFYCPVGATSDFKCTATQLGAFAYSLMNGDCTATGVGAITCTKTNGTAFGTLATLTPGTGVATALGIAPGTTGSFTTQDGSITTGHCLQWGPGAQDAGAACGSGGGSLTVTDGTTTVNGTTRVTFNGATVSGTTPNASVTISGGAGQTNFTTHAALISATTTFSTTTLMQQGYYASGDGGAAFYDWNTTSFCPSGTMGSPTTADGLVCILPSGQSASTGGRYLLRMLSGTIDARQLGFKDDASDNAPYVAGMNNAMFLTGAHIVFSSSSVHKQANYWFLTQPLSVVHAGGISCGDGSQADVDAPSVTLAFAAGINGVEWLNSGAAALRGLSAYATNNLISRIGGCNIYAASLGLNLTDTTINGSATTYIPFVGVSGSLGGGASITNPNLAIGDSLAIFPNRTQYWFFTASISGSTLTVSTNPTSFQTGNGDVGILPGQQLQATGLPHGIYIKKQLTGTTGQSGTYSLNYSIASPPLPNEAVSGGTIGSEAMDTEVQSGQPMFAPGTTITSCSTNSANQCPPSTVSTAATGSFTTASTTIAVPSGLAVNAGMVVYDATVGAPVGAVQTYAGTTLTLTSTSRINSSVSADTLLIYGGMVLSNTATRGQDWQFFLLPGPNSLQGDEHYAVTTSLAGHTFAQTTGGISGTTLTVSAGPTLDLGQVVTGINGTVSTTTSGGSPLTIGQYQNIQVASCTGIVSGQFVIGFDSGNAVFPPGTTVNTCAAGSPNLLSVNVNTNPTTVTSSGSPVVQGLTYNTAEPQMWIGEPMTGTDIASNSTVQSWAYEPDDWQSFNVTLNNNATGTTTSGTWALGGAIDAAPSGTTLNFMSGSANITGVSGGGVYTLDQSATLAGGSHLYAYDTPGTMYITSGPRNILPETPIWTDAFPFGAVAYKIYGTSPSHETVIVTQSRPEIGQQLAALVAHASGSGKMWALTSGYYRNTGGVTEGNVIKYFSVGINFAGGQDMIPSSGGDGSYDMRNRVFFTMLGRLTVGNNTGGSVDIGTEYDENFIADVAEYGGVGTMYYGLEMQSEDESYNTHVFESVCGTNGSPMIGNYTSGAEWNGTCVPNQQGSTFAAQSLVGAQDGGQWSGNLFGLPYVPPTPPNVFQPTPTGVTCTGTPTSSFKSIGGIVTHC